MIMMNKWIILLLAVMVSGTSMAQPKDDDAKYAVELLKPGTQAPDLKWKTADGKDFKLSELRGQYVVLDFWASWCPDCRKDAPNMKRMYEQFHNQGVAFVGVSFDTDADSWKKAIAKYGLNYTQVCEMKRMKESLTAQEYGVKWIPSMYLINPEGKVIFGTVLSYKVENTLYELTDKHYVPNIDSLFIDGSKGKLSAVIQKPAMKTGEKCPMVMLCHGFTGNKESKLLTLLADSLQANGIASIRFDFNGHGKSEGPFQEMTVPNEIEDAKKVFDYVRDLRYVSDIAIVGHSQGGVVAAMTAGELERGDMKAVVLFAPAGVIPDDAIRGIKPDGSMAYDLNPLDPPEYMEIDRGLRLGRNYIKTAQKLKIYQTANKYQGPALILHGTGDRVVPYTYGERFHDIWPKSNLLVLDSFDHGFTQCLYHVCDKASKWLINTLKGN